MFKFSVGQCVKILGGREAVITAQKNFGWREPDYDVQWLKTDTFDFNGSLTSNVMTISESALYALQPVPAEVTTEVVSGTTDYKLPSPNFSGSTGAVIDPSNQRNGRKSKPARNRKRR